MKLKNEKVLNHNLLRYLVNFWTIVLYLAIVADFLEGNTLVKFLGPISAIYIALLAVYTAEKEFERWHDYHIGRHPGEIYVFVWTVLIFILLVLEVLRYHDYAIPSEVFTSYIVAVGILAITKKSKTNYLTNDESK